MFQLSNSSTGHEDAGSSSGGRGPGQSEQSLKIVIMKKTLKSEEILRISQMLRMAMFSFQSHFFSDGSFHASFVLQ